MGRKQKKSRPPTKANLRNHEKVASRSSAQPGAVDFIAKHEIQHPASVLAVCVFLLSAVLLVFGQTLRHEFVNYDDILYVYKNAQVIAGVTAEGIGWAFQAQVANWHPLTWISHMLDCQLYGLEPWGHHLTSVLLHAATAILLFLVLLRMTGALWLCAFVAAVFAIHPLRVESVAWVAERKDVLSGFFFVLTIGAYVESVRRPFSLARYLTVIALFALGLMSKPMLVTLPVVLLLLDYWPLGRVPDCGNASGSPRPLHLLLIEKLPLLIEKLPLFALVLLSCGVTLWAQRGAGAMGVLEHLPLGWRLGNAAVATVTYLGQFFYPAHLAVYYPHPGFDLPAWKILGASLVLIGVTAGVWVWRRKHPYLLVGWLWYLVMLLPVIGLVQVGNQAMADRYTYLPQIGIAIGLTWGIAQVTRTWTAQRPWIPGLAALIIIGILTGCAWRQASVWRNSETLWTHALAHTSRNSLAHNNLGVVLYGRGQIDKAMEHYRKALEFMPEYVEAHNNLGITLARRGQLAEATTHFRRAVELKPGYVEAHTNLGHALILQGRTEAAITHFNKAIDLRPTDVEAHFQLANALAETGRVEDAIAYYWKVLELRPAYMDAYSSLAWLRATYPEASARDGEEAIELARRAAQLVGRDVPELLDTLAAAYAEAGRFPEALATARRALDLATRQQKSAALRDAIDERITLYEAGTPYREKRSEVPHAEP